jgi:hypothetical protein
VVSTKKKVIECTSRDLIKQIYMRIFCGIYKCIVSHKIRFFINFVSLTKQWKH